MSDNNLNKRIARFIVNNPDEAISASYNTTLGDKNAENYASYNAKMNKGQVIAQYLDGTSTLYKDFSVKTDKR